MGYTHYWTKAKAIPPKVFRAATLDCKRVLTYLWSGQYAKTLELVDGYEGKGYPVLGDGVVRFNGSGPDGHENFVMTRERSDFACCKTDRKPYDLAVCCCLVVFKHHAGDSFGVGSDGDHDEANWPEARAVCQKFIGYGERFRCHDPLLDTVLGVKGLKYKENDTNYRGYSSSRHPHYEFDNGWHMVRHLDRRNWRPGSVARLPKVEVFEKNPFYDREQPALLTADTLAQAVTRATNEHLTRLVSAANLSDLPALVAAAREKLATEGSWLGWFVVRDCLQDHDRPEAELLRKALPAAAARRLGISV